MGLFDLSGNRDLKLKLFAILDGGKYGDTDFIENSLRNYERGFTDSTIKNLDSDMEFQYQYRDKISGDAERWLIQGIREFLRQKELGRSFS